MDLPTVLRLAGEKNLDIQIARQRLAEARAERESALWEFLPWVTPGVSYRRHNNLLQDVTGNMIDVDKQSYAVGPTLTGQLDLGDAIYRNLAAQQLVKAADFAFEAQREDSVLAAAEAYYELLKAQAAVQVNTRAIAISTNYAAQIRQAANAGLAFRGDVLRVDVQTERSRLALRQTQEQVQTATARLALVLHLNPAILLQPNQADFVPLRLAGTNLALHPLVEQALASRPELKQSGATVQAARQANKGATYGPLIPSLNAQVFAGGLGGGADHQPDRFGESEDYLVGLGWRIGPGGLFDRGRLRSTEARLQVAALSDLKLRDEITRQVVEALARVQSLSDQLETAQRAVAAAEETLRLTRERKEFAVGVVLEDIQAQQDLTRAQLDLATALAEHNKAQYALRRAVGGALTKSAFQDSPRSSSQF